MQCEHQYPVESSFESLTPHKPLAFSHRVHGLCIKYFWKLAKEMSNYVQIRKFETITH